MFASKPFTASYVVDGNHTTITFYPESFTVRICDAAGHRLREFFWYQTWKELLATLKSFTHGDMALPA